MKWYFALSAVTMGHHDHDWDGMIKAAVCSARRNTWLRPHFIFDGEACPLTREIELLGAKVIFHRVSLYEQMVAQGPSFPFAIASGSYLRIDIPWLERDEDFVLYTDCDVIFRRHPSVTKLRPRAFACAPQMNRGDYEDMNSGVMLINVRNMRHELPAFRQFIVGNLARLGNFDQTALAEFYNDRYDLLPDGLNWKPYWGSNPEAEIIHFHGPKPAAIRKMLADADYFDTASVWRRLFDSNPNAYAEYLQEWDGYFDQSQKYLASYQDDYLKGRNLVDSNPSGRRPIMHKHKFSLVGCARWEEAHIVEWVEYHRSIGFDHIYIYSNDDSPETLCKVLLPYLMQGGEPYITYRHFPFLGRQIEMYRHFLETYKDETEWLIFLDIDEFLTLKGVNNIHAFISVYGRDWDCIYFNWLLFGNNGKMVRDDDSVLTGYTRRSSTVDPHTKTIIRSAAVNYDVVAGRVLEHASGAFWHFWDGYQIPGLRLGNVLGESMAAYTKDWPKYAEQFNQREGFSQKVIACGYISHFIFKSEEDFLRRAARGSVASFGAQADWATMYRENAHQGLLQRLNEVEDTYLADYWRAQLQRLEPIEIVPRPRWPNIALNKPAKQSSIYQGHGPSGGNNGEKNGRFGFHTELEARPWWKLDLASPHWVHEFRLYNRIDDPGCAARAGNLSVEVSGDGTRWTTIFTRASPTSFGGIDGHPLLVELTDPILARFLRVRLNNSEFLHLDEVEVYGVPG